MAVPIKKLNVSLIKRNAIKRGPTSSDAWNDSFEETVNDLSRITAQWNDSLFPLLATIPDGTNDLDAYTDGLDGRTLLVDSEAVSTVSNTTYFNIADDRPNSVKEQFGDVYTTITQLQQSLETQISNAGGALTDAQKNSIGANIFDSLSTSSSTSLDGKSENSRLNIIQVARDMYGPSFSLNNDGAAVLTNSVMAMVDALLELHNGNWSGDIALNHNEIGFLPTDGTGAMTGALVVDNAIDVAAPDITFTGDSDTGIYSPAPNQVAISAGGAQVMKFAATISNLTGGLIASSLLQTNTVFRQSLGYYGLTTDGPSAIGHIFDTLVTYANGAAKLVSVRNNGAEVFSIGLTGFTTTDAGLSKITDTDESGGGIEFVSSSANGGNAAFRLIAQTGADYVLNQITAPDGSTLDSTADISWAASDEADNYSTVNLSSTDGGSGHSASVVTQCGPNGAQSKGIVRLVSTDQVSIETDETIIVAQGLTSDVPFQILGVSGQTGNLQEWKSTDGFTNTVVAKMSPAGLFTTDTVQSETFLSTPSGINATNIDWSISTYHTKTLGANTTFTFSNEQEGQEIKVLLTNTTDGWDVTWPATVKWTGESAPTMTSGIKTDIYTFLKVSDIYGSYEQNYDGAYVV